MSQPQAILVLLRITTLPLDALSSLAARHSPPLVDELLELDRALESQALELCDALYLAAGTPDASDGKERARGRLALVALRRDVHNRRPIRARTIRRAEPWLKDEVSSRLQDYLDALRKVTERRRELAAAFRTDLADARRALIDRVGRPLVEAGIRLASRSLISRIHALRRLDVSRWGHDERHTANKALAYVARFCTKTSPNGLFCATAMARVHDGPTTVHGGPPIERTDVLLSVAEARKVAACLAVDPAIRELIVPRPNPTLRETDEAWTFWQPASSRRAEDDEILSRAKDHPVARMFIEEATPGSRNVPELLRVVAERCGVDSGELRAFYEQLVERGILIGEVEIPYNSRRPLRYLASRCREAGCVPAWLEAVENLEASVEGLSDLGSAGDVRLMDAVVRDLPELPHTRPILPDELFRVDAASGVRVTLPAKALAELEGPFRAYIRLFAAMYPERIYRTALARRFLGSFPADTDVPLLDLYHGIFEPGKLERPAAFPDPSSVAGQSPAARAADAVTRRARKLFAGLARAAPVGGEVELTEEQLGSFLDGAAEPPWMGGALFQVIAREARDIDEGRYRLVLNEIFPGAGLALARFAHLHGAGLPEEQNRIVQELRRGWSCLEREGAILAELTYTHNARTANASLRPAIYPYEIELPGDKASPGAEVIHLRDLVVRWVGAEERFALRWVPRDVEVLPVINSGVNPVGIISFLVAIGQQGFQPVGYFPAFEEQGIDHWPRFACGKLVLFRERWALGQDRWPRIPEGHAPAGEAEFFLEVARWREQAGIPRHVFLHTSSDAKPRYLDLDSPLFVDQLRRTVAGSTPGQETIHVTEMLPGPHELWIEGPGGRYASEFLVQMHDEAVKRTRGRGTP